ncbi:MAG TPA: glycosyltransferase family 4 protein [Bacteroidales bacterium]|nr:glycosyltransferase family 4 protein [Bacteroidales bacterium]
MRILFFIDSLTAGGKERRLVQLMKALHQVPGVEFRLALMSKEIHYTDVFELNIEYYFILRKTKKDTSIFRKFYSLCKKYRPDIVHCWDSMTNMYAIPACKILNIKLVNGMIVDSPQRWKFFNKHWLRGRILFPFSDVIVGNSYSGLEAYHAPRNKSICIYNGVDLNRFNNLKHPDLVREEIFEGRSSDLFIVGMVAAFEDRKDYKTLIESAIILTSIIEKIRFLLVGDGTRFDDIKSLVPDMLLKKIILLGKRSDVESIINTFNIGVLLTNSKVHGEGISNSIIEYMALKKPVIATRGGGTNEIIFENKNGYLIDSACSDQLNEKIRCLFENQELCDRLGNEGRKMVRSKFDIKVMTDRFLEIYSGLVNKN